MWEAISKIFTSSQTSVPAWCFLVLMFSLFISAVRAGLINIHTTKLTIGGRERELRIIRRQVEWVHIHCQGLIPALPHMDGIDEWRTKYILELMYDEIITWITFNHLSTDETEVRIKQEQLWSVVQANVENPIYQSEEFKQWLFEDTRFIISILVKIRQTTK